MVLNGITNIPHKTFTELSQTKQRPTENKLIDSLLICSCYPDAVVTLMLMQTIG